MVIGFIFLILLNDIEFVIIIGDRIFRSKMLDFWLDISHLIWIGFSFI